MTRSTTSHYRHIAMKLGRRPAGKTLVAGAASGSGANVCRRFTSGLLTVMTARAVGGAGERTVIRFGTTPGRIRLMAALAICRGRDMATVFARCNGSVVAAGATRSD